MSCAIPKCLDKKNPLKNPKSPQVLARSNFVSAHLKRKIDKWLLWIMNYKCAKTRGNPPRRAIHYTSGEFVLKFEWKYNFLHIGPLTEPSLWVKQYNCRFSVACQVQNQSWTRLFLPSLDLIRQYEGFVANYSYENLE